jgi:hypothetical protein
MLAKLAVTCAMVIAGQTPPDVVYTNLHRGQIPAQIHPERMAEIKELHLFVSPDRGKTWHEEDKIAPSNAYFGYWPATDGEYWFHVVTVNQQNKQDPRVDDLAKTPPMLKLVIDTKLPELKITTAQRQGDELAVSWWVNELHPDPSQLKVEYRTADSTTWTSMPLTPNPTGTTKAKVNTSAPLVVRLSFKDLASNYAEVEAPVTGTVTTAGYKAQPPLEVPPLPGGPSVPGGPPSLGGAPPTGQDLQLPQATKGGTAIASSSDPGQGTLVPQHAPPTAAAPRGMPPLELVNDPEIVLEYEVSKVGPSGLSKVEVWITRDGGANWVRFAEDPDAIKATTGGKYKRTLMLPGEGVYGISLVVKSKAGMGKPGPRPGDVPEMMVEVDTTPPQAQLLPLTPDVSRRDTLILSWTAEDRNLGPTPITLEWAERPTGPWQPIATDLPNTTRQYAWRLPPSLPSHVHLRLTVRDAAGNLAVAVTREPQLVDLSEPEGRLIRVSPAKK